MVMMNRFFRLILFAQILIIGLLPACSKEPSYPEAQRIEDYETNRQNSLRLLTPVMYHYTDNEPEELFKIVHISDAHVSAWSHSNQTPNPRNLKEAVQFANDVNARINVMVATGDHISNFEKTTQSDAINYMNAFTNTLYKNNIIPTFTSTGNHDVNMLNSDFTTYALSKTDIYNLLTSKINYKFYTEGTENYYYADLVNPMGGFIRVIALDVTDQDVMVFNAQHNAILSQKQIDWLCHTALKKDMTEFHSVIILVHQPLPPDDEGLKNIVYRDYLHNWDMLPEIIETFRTKQSLTRKYENRHHKSDSISVDVSFNDTPGEFICYLGGHLHTYLNYEVKGFPETSLPKQIMILANNMSSSDKNESSPIERTNNGFGIIHSTCMPSIPKTK